MHQRGTQQGVHDAVIAEIRYRPIEQDKLRPGGIFQQQVLNMLVQSADSGFKIFRSVHAGQQSTQFGFHRAPAIRQTAGQLLFCHHSF